MGHIGESYVIITIVLFACGVKLGKEGCGMSARSKQIRDNVCGFLLLFFVSLYRQLSLRNLPDDGLRTYVLYACYCFRKACAFTCCWKPLLCFLA